MPLLIACVADRHLFHVGSDVEAAHVVRVIEVVAEVVFGKVKWDEEACVVGGQAWSADKSDCEFGKVDLLAAKSYELLGDGERVHGGDVPAVATGRSRERRQPTVDHTGIIGPG